MAREVGRRLIACSLSMLLVGCGAPATSIQPTASNRASLEPSPSVGATIDPTASPWPSSNPTPTAAAAATTAPDPCRHVPFDGPWAVDPLLPGSAVKVAVAELNLRAGPCTAAATIGTLERGRVLIVSNQLFGPVTGNGHPWYFVSLAPNSYPFGTLPPLPGSPFPDGADPGVGWIAASDGAVPYVTPMAPRCPTTVDLENVAAMLPAERLACFETPFVLEGTYGCGGCGGDGGPVSEPRWLADVWEFDQLRVRWEGEFLNRPVGLHFPPSAAGPPAEGSIIRVTVHVDDPAAPTCSIVWTIEDPDFRVPDEIAIAYCRERLVVDSYEVVGTDPDFPG